MPLTRPFVSWVERVTKRRAATPGRRLKSSQIFILPTRFGITAALANIAMFLAALNYQNSLVFLLAFLLAALGVVTMIACHAQLRGLTLGRLYVEPVFAQETAQLRLEISHSGPIARSGLHLCAERSAGQALTIEPGTQETLAIALAARSRGRYVIAAPQLACDEPFSTFRAWSPLKGSAELLVYPRPARQPPPPPDAGQEAGRWGVRSGEPEDFAELARYRPGDRPGQVAWQAYARTGELHRKAFFAPRGGATWLDLADVPETDIEARLQVLARWLLDASHRARASWGLRLPGYTLGPDHGSAHLHRCLRALALYPGPYDA